MKIHFETLRQSRKLIAKRIGQLNAAQLNEIPKNFNNNIAWNIGHLVITEQLLCYRLSGNTCSVSEELIGQFQKGSAPKDTISEETFDYLLELFVGQPDELEKDYNSGLFKAYNAYTTSVNVTLKSIDDAIVFNTYHEGIHLGIILQLLKLV